MQHIIISCIFDATLPSIRTVYQSSYPHERLFVYLFICSIFKAHYPQINVL